MDHFAQTNPEAVRHGSNRPPEVLLLPGVLPCLRQKIGAEKHHPRPPSLKMPRQPDAAHHIDPAAAPRIPFTRLARSDPGTDKYPPRPLRQPPTVRPPGQIRMPAAEISPRPRHGNPGGNPPFFQGPRQNARAQHHDPGFMIQENRPASQPARR